MTEINNSIIKLVSSLAMKKYRDREGLFVAEGLKCVRDTWGAFRCRYLIATKQWYEKFGTAEHYESLVIANKGQMARISQFNTPSDVLAVYEIERPEVDAELVNRSLNIVLDNIQDPGNLGTIVRLADWFDIPYIFCNESTVDIYNHKVVQATMGAIANVKVIYTDLEQLLNEHPSLPVYGTFLDGDNLFTAKVERRAFVIFGNEGQGISPRLAARATRRLLIPAASPHHASDSLNVGTAAAITLARFATA